MPIISSVWKRPKRWVWAYEIIIPVSLYPAIEAGYLDETYKKAYADTALESIGAQNFAIQMQVARWNGTYFYKLYHCISVWN